MRFPQLRIAVPVLFAALAPALVAAASTPLETLLRFHTALRENDRETALAQLAANVVIYEQGFADTSRKSWAGGQLQDALDFARNTQRVTLQQQTQRSGDLAWVVSTTQTDGLFEGQVLTLLGTETAILRSEGGDWKIIHLHWSAHEKPRADSPVSTPAQKK